MILYKAHALSVRHGQPAAHATLAVGHRQNALPRKAGDDSASA